MMENILLQAIVLGLTIEFEYRYSSITFKLWWIRVPVLEYYLEAKINLSTILEYYLILLDNLLGFWVPYSSIYCSTGFPYESSFSTIQSCLKWGIWNQVPVLEYYFSM